MNIKYESNKVIIEGIKDFEPVHIFECGQCFRWIKEEDNSYTGVVSGKILNVKKEDDVVYFDNTNKDDFENIWFEYFDLNRDYSAIKEKLRQYDEYLEKAVQFGYGIRLLNQDEWETLISFIISANNRIPMIKRAIKNLSEKYGREIGEYKGKKYYSFPTIEDINNASVEDIRNCSVGFRDKYIKGSSQRIISENINIYDFKNLDSDKCKKELIKFNGVGSKVADCVMLFSMNKYDSFPVDVWVKRVMEEFYVDDDLSLERIRKFGTDKFKDISGFAQQYLFYYARELGIGSKK